jgi:hypothetical protein
VVQILVLPPDDENKAHPLELPIKILTIFLNITIKRIIADKNTIKPAI